MQKQNTKLAGFAFCCGIPVQEDRKSKSKTHKTSKTSFASGQNCKTGAPVLHRCKTRAIAAKSKNNGERQWRRSTQDAAGRDVLTSIIDVRRVVASRRSHIGVFDIAYCSYEFVTVMNGSKLVVVAGSKLYRLPVRLTLARVRK
jgi:hypothetical protein